MNLTAKQAISATAILVLVLQGILAVKHSTSSSSPKLPSGADQAVRPPSMSHADWLQLLALRNQLLSQNKPITFYARCIDQNDQPVTGAVLTAMFSRVNEEKLKSKNFAHLHEGEELARETLRLVSDAQGLIQFTGRKGKFIVIEHLECPGYIWTLHGYKAFDYPLSPAESDAADPNKRYVIHLWKKSFTEPLARTSQSIAIPRPATNAVVNLVLGHTAENEKDGDLTIYVEFLHPDDPNRMADRRIHLIGINGTELLEATAPYPYQAPTSGYTSTFSYDVLPSTGYGPGGSWNWTKNFYLRMGAKPVYACMHVDFDSGNMIFELQTTINPAGSSNLEPDPEKSLTSPSDLQRIDQEIRVR